MVVRRGCQAVLGPQYDIDSLWREYQIAVGDITL